MARNLRLENKLEQLRPEMHKLMSDLGSLLSKQDRIVLFHRILDGMDASMRLLSVKEFNYWPVPAAVLLIVSWKPVLLDRSEETKQESENSFINLNPSTISSGSFVK